MGGSVEFLLVVVAFVAVVLWIRRKDRVGELESRISRLEAQVSRLQQGFSSTAEPSPSAPTPRAPSATTAPMPVPQAFTRPTPAAIPVPEPLPPAQPSLPNPPPEPFETTVASAPPIPRPSLSKAPTPQPSLLSRLMGENPVVRIGLVVFLLGVSFLVRQIAQAGLFPPEARLGLASLAGFGLLWLGWKSRTSRPHFALPLQGGALGVLFLVLFAAFRLYHFLPTEASLAVAILLLGITGSLAVVQDSAALAYLGMAAGYAAPILLSSGSGSHVGLFTYYALLDAAIFGISWFRSWRSLHVTAFLATYTLGAVWGASEYRAEHFLSCEIFVWVYYLLFSGTALLFARRAYRNIFGYVDGTLFFGVPMATLALQYRLFESDPWPMAWTSFAMAIHHLVMARWIWSSIRSGKHPHLRTMAETLSVLGVSFASLAIPLAVSGPVTALVWAVEGAGLVFLGLRQNRPWSLAMGLFLALAASLIQWSVESPDSVGTAVIAISLWICAWLLGTLAPWPALRSRFATALLGWMLLGVSHDSWQILEHFHFPRTVVYVHLTLAIAAGVAVLSTLAGRRLRFPPASLLWWPTTLIWFLFVLGRGATALAGQETSLLPDAGWLTHLAIPVALGFALFLIRRGRLQGTSSQDALQSILLHGLLWQAFVWSWIAAKPLGGDWSLALGMLAITVPLAVLGFAKVQAVLEHLSPRLYRSAWILPWWLSLAGLVAASLLLSASSGSLTWLPVFNPLDLAMLAGLVALTRISDDVTSWLAPRMPCRAVSLVLFLAWTGSTLNRCFHHYVGLPWDLKSLWDDRALQAGWSLLLTSQALGLMLLAARRRLRLLWMAGAAILAVAVIKLFLVDLSGHGATARIVSFLGMGALMVAIGYVSPLPPSATQAMPDRNLPPS
jgi:uncharacterized membrane protein